VQCKTMFFSFVFFDMSTWQILDRLLSPTNFPHKHHGAIPSRYAQKRAGEFGGGQRNGGTEE
jgi:hypothetical protein